MNFPYRFKVVFLSFLAVFICYIDRVNISVAIIPMQQQFGWSESQVGIILGSFYFGYMITMTLGGYLAEESRAEASALLSMVYACWHSSHAAR